MPTGVINKDDVVDEDFRIMFATLNHKRLIADKIDEKTGYPTYGFTFKHAVGFEGALEKTPYLIATEYNTRVSDIIIDGARSEGLDYDADVSSRTYTRTILASDKDYYLFRLGINNYSEQYLKYLYRDYVSGKLTYALPVYENSFYFYFGLHPGATAIDELNKQCFAPCETKIDKNNE